MCEPVEPEAGCTLLCESEELENECEPEDEECEVAGIVIFKLGRVCDPALATAAGPVGTGRATTVTKAAAAVRINARENLI